MVNSFHIDTTRDSITQVQSSDKSNGDNGNNGAKPSPRSNGIGLTINVNVAQDPIVRGNEQTITVTVSDSDSGDKISGANVKGDVKYVTGHREILSGTSNQDGIFRHSWRISGNANIGTFVVHVDVTADGSKSGSKERSFQVIAKGPTLGPTSNLNRTPNQTEENGDNDRCITDKGYRLSKGSYIDNGRSIVGSPCDPVEFCKDKNSTDPIVIDHCDDIWDDVGGPEPEPVKNVTKPVDPVEPQLPPCDGRETTAEGACIPICDSDQAVGYDGPCRDEGDFDQCEEGFKDKGNGCEPIEEEPPVECPDYGYTVVGNKCVPIEEEGTPSPGIIGEIDGARA